MKLLLSTFTMAFIFTACDAPVRTRVPTASDYSVAQTESDSYTEGTGTTDGSGVVDSGETGNETTEPGFEDCEYLSPEFNGGSLGNFGLCRHTTDERRYKTVFAQSNYSGTCFIPVHVQTSGNSFKLGNAECVHNQADTNYYMTLTKELVAPYFSYSRPEAINGVMVIQASSLNSYMGCMNSKEDYLIGTTGCCLQRVYNQSTGRYSCTSINSQCESAANNYANNICALFKQNHGNNYRQVTFSGTQGY